MAATASVAPPGHLRTLRWVLPDGARTTVHVAAFDTERTVVRVACLRPRMPLATWCDRIGVADAIVGGFYTRHPQQLMPLGELRIAGVARASVPFDAPWDERRACVSISRGVVRIGPRPAFDPTPTGDLLQAGPQLVGDGHVLVRDGEDPEGFSSGSRQFDSDITRGRYPRAALGLVGAPARRLLAVVCDGRSRQDAGMTLPELAALLRELGATDALNLDGGGSASLVCGGALRNRPRASLDVDIPGGRALATALIFEAR